MRIPILILAAALTWTPVFHGQTTAPQPRQTDQGPSVQETLDYVTSKIDRAKFPDWNVSVSSDHEKLIQRGTAGGWVWYTEADVMSLDQKKCLSMPCFEKGGNCRWESGFSVVDVSCKSNSLCAKDCFKNADRQGQQTCKNLDSVGFPGYPLDDESEKRLVRAYTHLVGLLQAEYRASHDNKDDPFVQ